MIFNIRLDHEQITKTTFGDAIDYLMSRFNKLKIELEPDNTWTVFNRGNPNEPARAVITRYDNGQTIYDHHFDQMLEAVLQADLPERDAADIYTEINLLADAKKDRNLHAVARQADRIQSFLSGTMSKATFPDKVYTALEHLKEVRTAVLGEEPEKVVEQTEFEKMLDEQFMIK